MSARDERIAAVRRFNRLYTKQIGLLQEGLLASPYSLSEVRLLYEIAQSGETTASALSTALGLDMGYVSRMITRLARHGFIEKRSSEEDRRKNLLSLSDEGAGVFSGLDRASSEQVEAMLEKLPEEDGKRLVAAMRTITDILSPRQEEAVSYLLRSHRAGDLGWIVERHGRIYNEEYGWNEEFEALVAQIAADFLRGFDISRERCWIAERDGENVGSVLLVRHPERPGVAKLRLLLVEPRARGLGIGKRLVRECIVFAREAGYGRITLWTNSVLHAARRIYEQEGFELVDEEAHHSFGHDLTGQTWELEL